MVLSLEKFSLWSKFRQLLVHFLAVEIRTLL
jgi:hypothetical protein